MFENYKKYATIKIMHYPEPISLCCSTNGKALTLLQLTLPNGQFGPFCQTFQFSKRNGCDYAISHLIPISKTQFPAGLLILTLAVDKSIPAAGLSILEMLRVNIPL